MQWINEYKKLIEGEIAILSSAHEVTVERFEDEITVVRITTKGFGPYQLVDSKGLLIDFGKFDIVIDYAPDYYMVRAIAQTPNYSITNRDVTHPHVKLNIVCLGESARPRIRTSINRGYLTVALDIIDTILSNYNPDSPHINLDDWYGRVCRNCEGVCRHSSVECPKCRMHCCADWCGKFRCSCTRISHKKCKMVCDTCGANKCKRCLNSMGCTSCTTTCVTCDTRFNYTGAQPRYCTPCRPANCAMCGYETRNKHLTNGLCVNCLNSPMITCSTCGENTRDSYNGKCIPCVVREELS